MACNAHAFVQPSIPNHTILNLKTMCFLLEHKSEGGSPSEYVLFDCGSRKDYWNGSPKTCSMIANNLVGMQVEYGVDEILTASGFDLSLLSMDSFIYTTIVLCESTLTCLIAESIVWSHWHWDHIGDGSRFPSTVDVVVGPGFINEFAPGWPENPDCPVLQSDLTYVVCYYFTCASAVSNCSKPKTDINGREHRIHEPKFDIEVVGFPAYDYFGDGSFYLLDVPGVCSFIYLFTSCHCRGWIQH